MDAELVTWPGFPAVFRKGRAANRPWEETPEKKRMQGRQAPKPRVGGEGSCLLGNSGPFYFVAWLPQTEGIELFFAELCRFIRSR